MTPVPPRDALRSLAFAVLYVLAGVLGRATVVDDRTLALVWPAAGVAVLWFLLQGRQTRWLDIGLLSVTAFGVNFLTGSSPQMAAVLLAANVAQTLVAVEVLCRCFPPMADIAKPRTLDSTYALLALLLAAGLSGLVGATIGVFGVWAFEGEPGWIAALLWWGRNVTGIVAVTALGHLLAHRVRYGAPPRSGPHHGLAGPVELTALVGVSAAVYSLAFLASDLPLAFPLLAVTVWAGLRLPTDLAALHSIACGAVAVGFTIWDRGPFARVAETSSAALFAQAFVLIVVVTGLALATSLDERDRLALTLLAAQQEAAAQASMMSTVVASVSEGITVVNGDGEVLVDNDAARRAMGYAPGQPIDRLPDVVVSAVNRAVLAESERPSYRALRGETVRDLDILLPTPEGDRILSVSATPMPADERGVPRAVLVARDVTEDRRQRDDLGSFAGVVAHDLSNPLGVIDGWVEAIEDDLDDPADDRGVDPVSLQSKLDRIKGASSRMRRLIEDLLANATAENRSLELVKVDLDAVTRDVVSARGARELVEVRELPFVRADAPLVRQLLDNLVANALKYVAPGVRPQVVLSGTEEGEEARIRVADNGIGVPAGEHELIFEQFHRAHHGAYTGTGLGLAICRRIVERHGGTIAALPNPTGQGTVFEFTLPLA